MERYESAVPGTAEWDALRAKHGCAESIGREMKRLVCATASASLACARDASTVATPAGFRRAQERQADGQAAEASAQADGRQPESAHVLEGACEV